MKKPVKLGKPCYDHQMNSQFEKTEPLKESKFCNPGGGRKVTGSEVREVLEVWFIVVIGNPKKLRNNHRLHFQTSG